MTRRKHDKEAEEEAPSVAALLGAGMAHFQHACDGLLGWGFKTLRKASVPKKKKKSGKEYPALEAAEKAGRGLLGFVGEMGESYYREYTGLKKDG